MTFLVVFILIISSTVGVTYALERKQLVNPVISRKLLHIVAIGLSAISVFYIDVDILIWVVGVCIPILSTLVLKGFFRDRSTNRKSWGILYFNLVFFILLILFPENHQNIYYPLMVMALADGLAAIVGVLLVKNSNRKTLGGSVTFFIVSLLVFSCSDFIWPHLDIGLSFSVILFICFTITLIEFISQNGSDNLSVPILALYWLLIQAELNEISIFTMLVLAILSFAVFKLKWLKLDGAFLAFIIGSIYFSSPLPISVVPGIIFFLIGSILSKLPNSKEKNSSSRNAVQVFANGGIPTILVAIFFISDHPAFLFASIVGYTVALSDTTSSEIGSRYSTRAIDILGSKKFAVGSSGGISSIGILAGAIAAVFIAFVSGFFLDLTLTDASYIALLGLFGNILDSIVGSLFQSKSMLSENGYWIDGYSKDAVKSGGIKWLTNDLTNFISILIASAFALFIFY